MERVKRKRVVLSISDKLDILTMLDKSVSYSTICEKYGIGRSTVGDIRKSRDKLTKFRSDIVSMGTSRDTKVMKLGDDQQLDQAVYIWFKQKRMEGVPISGPMLCEKALELNKCLNGESKFSASEGWKWRFCKRHGIRNLSVEGEKLSADKDGADSFVISFSHFIKEKKFSLDQIFNCDETGLYFRLLPDVTLAASFEKTADGRKKAKDRITLNACSNASGTIKLPLHMIGKSQRPRCFKGVNMDLLPVKYCGQKNAWMTANLFREWFHHQFVPHVRSKLTLLGEKPTALLLLDNCSAHPDDKELISDDGAIFTKFLPPNVTSLIQPMDQGILQTLKKRYKKKLLRQLIIEDDMGGSVVDFLKGVNTKVVAEMAAEAWSEIKQDTLRKSWQKIIPVSPLPTVSCGCAIWRGVRIRIRSDSEETEPDKAEQRVREETDELEISTFQDMLKEIGFDTDSDTIAEWLSSDSADSGVQLFTDNEICELVSKSSENEVQSDDDDSEEEDQCPQVSNSEAIHMFEQCLTWLEQQPEATVYNTTVLRELHSLATSKRMESLKQAKLTQYFNHT